MADRYVRKFEKLSLEERKAVLPKLNELADTKVAKSKKVKAAAEPVQENSDSSEEKPVKGRKEKKAKDPNAPKRALTPYFIYTTERRAAAKAEYPHLKPKELVSKMAEEWNGLSEAQKGPYMVKGAAAKESYAQAKKAYKP